MQLNASKMNKLSPKNYKKHNSDICQQFAGR